MLLEKFSIYNWKLRGHELALINHLFCKEFCMIMKKNKNKEKN
jgi:hypothetical protein